MTQIHKVQPQVHISVGNQGTSIPFDTDAQAEKEWRLTVDMLETVRGPHVGPNSRVIIHSNGCVWVDLRAVTMCTWTKEQRQQVPVHGLTTPPNLGRGN